MITNPNAVPVLVYGDSNTYDQARYADEELRRNPHYPGYEPRGYPARMPWRYPVVMQECLGENYYVIENGVGGRTVAGDNLYGWEGDGRNGIAEFGSAYAAHMPLGLVIINLGTNDANYRFQQAGRRPEDIANDLHLYPAVMAKYTRYELPAEVYVAPAHTTDALLPPDEEMYRGSEAITRQLAPLYEEVVRARRRSNHNAHFFDAGQVVSTSPAEGPSDGVHLNAQSHLKLGQVLAWKVQEILEGRPMPPIFDQPSLPGMGDY